MPAFEDAVDLGYRYLETDVHVTADGVLVAFHDDDLSARAAARQDQRAAVDARSRTALVDGKAPIPLLEELLGTFPEARVNIDCKADARSTRCRRRCAAPNALDRVCVASFSDRRLRAAAQALGADAVHVLGPVELGLLRLGLLRHSAGAGRPGAGQGGSDHGGQPAFVERAHRLGLQVHVWTIDDAAEMERLLDLGVDGIMTDRPAVLRQVARGSRRLAHADDGAGGEEGEAADAVTTGPLSTVTNDLVGGAVDGDRHAAGVQHRRPRRPPRQAPAAANHSSVDGEHERGTGRWATGALPNRRDSDCEMPRRSTSEKIS